MSQYFCGPLSEQPFRRLYSTLSELITRERGPGFTAHCHNFSDFRIVLRIINLAIQLRK